MLNFAFFKRPIFKIGGGNCAIAQIKIRKVQFKKRHIGSMSLCFIVEHCFNFSHCYISHEVI